MKDRCLIVVRDILFLIPKSVIDLPVLLYGLSSALQRRIKTMGIAKMWGLVSFSLIAENLEVIIGLMRIKTEKEFSMGFDSSQHPTVFKKVDWGRGRCDFISYKSGNNMCLTILTP